jgi:ATP-dependent exoDNAse (exonuclease V) beta subunit
MLEQVKASAGSGKTYELTARFLSLLAGSMEEDSIPVCKSDHSKGYCWPEIMAVTFTNKAASEMKERIIRSLKNRALNIQGDGLGADWESSEAKAQLTMILRRYNKLNIRTIDSLLNMIVRLFALELKISPEFEILFEPESLFDPVFNKFLTKCEDGDPKNIDLMANAINGLIRHEGGKGFWLAEKMRLRMLDILKHVFAYPYERLTDNTQIFELITPYYDSFKRSLNNFAAAIETDRLGVKKPLITYLTYLESLEPLQPPKGSAMICKDDFSECVKKADHGKILPKHEQLYYDLKLKHDEYTDKAEILSGAYALAPFVRIVEELRDEIIAWQQDHGVLLSSLLPKLASAMLNSDGAMPDAFCKMGSRLHHLLIDEFQDTSTEQWSAILPLAEECLSKNGSLFYVGDVKQAIYGWRGGEAELFDSIGSSPELSGISQTQLSMLEFNWRSLEKIVEFNNSFFETLADPDITEEISEQVYPNAPYEFRSELAEKISAYFENPAQSLPENLKRDGGYVLFQKVPSENAAEILEETQTVFSKLVDEITSRRDYRDICVLVRSNTHAQIVCDWLINKNIPVITENSLQLDRHILVRQLTSFLKFLDYPQDDLAFLEFISGKEIFQEISGIDSNRIISWLAQRQKGLLYRRFAEDFPEIWEKHFSPFIRKSGLMTPYDIVSELISRFKILERRPQDELYLRRFLEVIHLCEEKTGTSLASFLEFWDSSSAEEKVPLPENVNAVRIMTIHKSKGLEFPVVIVPFHHWSLPRADKTFYDAEIDGHNILTLMGSYLGEPYYENRTSMITEQLNLLYVAWTRAGEELYGFLPDKIPSRTICPVLNVINSIIGEKFNDEGLFSFGAKPGGDLKQQEEITGKHPTAIVNHNDSEELMSWLPRLRVYRHNLEDYSFDAKMRGELTHKAMELLIPGTDDEVAVEKAALSAIGLYPLAEEMKETLLQEIKESCLWALSIPDIRKAVISGRPESAIMDQKGNVHRADLLYMTAEEALVIEYKTGNPSPEHHTQVKKYISLLSQMPSHPELIRGLIVYLDGKNTTEVLL